MILAVQSYAGTTSDSHEEENAPPQKTHILTPDDVIDMTVYGESELSKTYRLDDSGKISVPLIGQVSLVGKTTHEAEIVITEALSKGYLVEPSVSIALQEIKPVYILGEVRVPGSYEYSTGMTVLKAVALAGGYTYRADQDDVKLVRSDVDGSKRYETVGTKYEIRPGDILMVEERFF